MSERQSDLLRAIDRLQQNHQAWVESDSREIADPFRQAISDTIELFGDGDIPGPLRRLEKAVCDMAGHWERFVADEALNAQAILPGQGFWKALEYVENVRSDTARPQKKFLEPITGEGSLTEQKVPDRQICLIYGFVDASGAPELWKLSEERSKPGTHTDRAKGWLPPHERAEQERRDRQSEIKERLADLQEEKIAAAAPPPPAAETIKDLIEQGVSATQIAKMKQIGLEEVFAEAEKLGLTVDANYSLTPKQTEKRGPGRPKGSKSKPKEQSESAVAVADPPEETSDGSPVAEILEYHAAGFDAETIADSMTSGGQRKWTAEEVQGIIAGNTKAG